MKRKTVDSSAVDQVGYDAERRLLEIQFKGGRPEWLPKEISDQVGSSRCDDPARVQRDVYLRA